MTETEAIQRLIATARGEIGTHETGDNQTKYAAAYDYDTRLYGFDMSGFPWCDYFVDWCFYQTFGFEVGSAMTYQYSGCSGASCEASASYYQAKGAFDRSPQVGDQIFFYVSGGINHTGIVESINGSTVTTIEGNSSDQVKRNQYRTSDASIAGFGHPAWRYAANLTDEDKPEETVTETADNPDAVCDAETWAYLASQMPIVMEGSVEYAVSALQAAINQICGYHELDIDGEFGPLTKTALINLKKRIKKDE